jgi:hypothetical protein
MNYINLFLFLVMIFLLINDFSKTKGKFMKAKIFHVIGLLFLIYFNYSCITWFIGVLYNLDKFYIVYNKDFGIMPGLLIMIDYIVLNIISLVVIICVFGLLKRNEKSRKFLLKLIPIIILVNIIPAYMGFYSKVKGDFQNYVKVLIVIGLSIILYGWVYFIYNSKLIKDFFNDK